VAFILSILDKKQRIMKTKTTYPKTIQKDLKSEFKKYSGIDAALLNLGIKFPDESKLKN